MAAATASGRPTMRMRRRASISGGHAARHKHACTPCGTRTRNLRIRSPTPCPLGQGSHVNFRASPTSSTARAPGVRTGGAGIGQVSKPTGLALPPTRQCQHLVCCGNNVGWPVKPPDSVLDAMLDLADPWMHKPDATWSQPVSSDEIPLTRGWAVDRVKKLKQGTR